MDIVTTLYGRQERSWQIQANCMGVDPDLFFPERGASTREAKEVCRGCVVREDCLEYALANGEKFGIWGGMSERERRRVRRARALQRRDTAVQRLLAGLHRTARLDQAVSWSGGPRPSSRRREPEFGPARGAEWPRAPPRGAARPVRPPSTVPRPPRPGRRTAS